VSEQENVQLIRGALAAFAGGDAQTFLNLFSDEVDFRHPMPLELWPWAGKHRGRARVAHALVRLARTLEFEQFEPREFIAQGDKVVVLVSERARSKATGIAVDNSYAHVYTVKDGTITQLLIFEDTAPIIAALRGSGNPSQPRH
jgi:ketosteroid isomerase-like protein